MRIEVDLGLCEGHGLCYFESSELFDLRDEDGKAVVLVDEVPVGLEQAARNSVQVCPERAIRVVE
jgi:ferredoxin